MYRTAMQKMQFLRIIDLKIFGMEVENDLLYIGMAFASFSPFLQNPMIH